LALKAPKEAVEAEAKHPLSDKFLMPVESCGILWHPAHGCPRMPWAMPVLRHIFGETAALDLFFHVFSTTPKKSRSLKS